MEGQVFACSWEKKGAWYRVWVKRRPKLTARGKTFNQADMRLYAVILKATGDGESDRRYDPPEPSEEPALERPTPIEIEVAEWVKALRKQRGGRRKPPEPLDTTEKIQRQFKLRVNEHFGFLKESGFRKPTFSRKNDEWTGMWWNATFKSKRRTLVVDIGQQNKEFANSAAFEINPVPVEDPWERFSSVFYIGLKYRDLGNEIAEFDLTHTLDEIMVAQFPIFASLFRGPLRKILIGEQWHDEYEFYRDR